MSLQNLLTKDYSSKPQPILLRFLVITGNLLAFMYLSGYYCNSYFGPVIKREGTTVAFEMREFSTLDMCAVMIALIVAVRQLGFRRPEIDSFNEIVYLPAHEVKSTLGLLFFTIFKFFYQLPNKKTGVIGWNGFFLDPFLKLNKSFREPHKTYPDEYLQAEKATVCFNFILIVSASISLWHSLSFKYEIRNTERRMILRSLELGNIITGIVVIILLTGVIFIADTKYLGVLFLVVIVSDIFRIVKKHYIDSRNSGYSLSMSDYLVSIKWISVIIFGVVLHGSLGALLLEKLGIPNQSQIYKAASYLFLFYRNAQERGTVTDVNKKIIVVQLLLVLYLSLLELIAKIKDAASLEVFDIHYASDIVKAFKKLDVKWTDPITENTYFDAYFLYKFKGILNIDEYHLFSNTFGFKKQYIRKLTQESTMVHRALDRFRNHFIARLAGNKRIWAQFWVIFKWVG